MSASHYFAYAIDIEGNEIQIPVNEEGIVQISSTKKIKSLKTNALKVFCRNNELEILEAPNAISVGCNKNKITSLFLENAETIHCAENKLTELYAPKATHIICSNNKLTKMKLESVVKLECGGNGLASLEAPNLQSIDCDIISTAEKPKPIELPREIEIKLKNKFDINDTWSYDIDSIEVEVTLDLDKELFVEDLTFAVALQEINFFSYEDESDIDGFDIYLMISDDLFGQHQIILDQAPSLPMMVKSKQKINFSIPLFSRPDGHQNFLDIIKQAPGYILKDEKELDLHITLYLNQDQPNEKYDYRIFRFDNPFYGMY